MRQDTIEMLRLDAARDDVLHPRALLARAGELAQRTVAMIRAEQNGAILASVALQITDQRLRIAYLEEIGDIIAA